VAGPASLGQPAPERQPGVRPGSGPPWSLVVVKLTEWARANGVHPKTAYRWWREGTLPVPARKVGPRTILVDLPASESDAVGLYARVSSHDQRADLERQVARLSDWAKTAGKRVVRVESEVGSGMNGARPKVKRLLADPKVSVVVVEHRDRLGRINTELVEAALAATGRRLVVLDGGEVDDDLVRDMVGVLTSFCARLYGRRSAKNRAEKALRCAAQDVGPQALSQPTDKLDR
jgi:putative resolvase